MKQIDIHYEESTSPIYTQHHAYIQDYDKDYAGISGEHIASIIKWSKDSPSCMVFWRDNVIPMQLCNDINYAKEMIAKYVTKLKK